KMILSLLSGHKEASWSTIGREIEKARGFPINPNALSFVLSNLHKDGYIEIVDSPKGRKYKIAKGKSVEEFLRK
ncbi:MAG: hypothetical protein ACP5SA_02685, partial [Candidatus Micrarchaeia archaeon]